MLVSINAQAVTTCRGLTQESARFGRLCAVLLRAQVPLEFIGLTLADDGSISSSTTCNDNFIPANSFHTLKGEFTKRVQDIYGVDLEQKALEAVRSIAKSEGGILSLVIGTDHLGTAHYSNENEPKVGEILRVVQSWILNTEYRYGPSELRGTSITASFTTGEPTRSIFTNVEPSPILQQQAIEALNNSWDYSKVKNFQILSKLVSDLGSKLVYESLELSINKEVAYKNLWEVLVAHNVKRVEMGRALFEDELTELVGKTWTLRKSYESSTIDGLYKFFLREFLKASGIATMDDFVVCRVIEPVPMSGEPEQRDIMAERKQQIDECLKSADGILPKFEEASLVAMACNDAAASVGSTALTILQGESTLSAEEDALVGEVRRYINGAITQFVLNGDMPSDFVPPKNDSEENSNAEKVSNSSPIVISPSKKQRKKELKNGGTLTTPPRQERAVVQYQPETLLNFAIALGRKDKVTDLGAKLVEGWKRKYVEVTDANGAEKIFFDDAYNKLKTILVQNPASREVLTVRTVGDVKNAQMVLLCRLMADVTDRDFDSLKKRHQSHIVCAENCIALLSGKPLTEDGRIKLPKAPETTPGGIFKPKVTSAKASPNIKPAAELITSSMQFNLVGLMGAYTWLNLFDWAVFAPGYTNSTGTFNIKVNDTVSHFTVGHEASKDQRRLFYVGKNTDGMGLIRILLTHPYRIGDLLVAEEPFSLTGQAKEVGGFFRKIHDYLLKGISDAKTTSPSEIGLGLHRLSPPAATLKTDVDQVLDIFRTLRAINQVGLHAALTHDGTPLDPLARPISKSLLNIHGLKMLSQEERRIVQRGFPYTINDQLQIGRAIFGQELTEIVLDKNTIDELNTIYNKITATISGVLARHSEDDSAPVYLYGAVFPKQMQALRDRTTKEFELIRSLEGTFETKLPFLKTLVRDIYATLDGCLKSKDPRGESNM